MTLPQRQDIWLAIRSIKASKVRSFLTVLGIVIGIVAAVSVVDIAQGVKHQVSGQINQFGKDLITVRPGQLLGNNSSTIAAGLSFLSPFGSGSSLTNSDINTVLQSNGVAEAVPLSSVNGEISLPGGSTSSTLVLGAGDQLPSSLNQSIAFGSFFDKTNDTQDVAVIGSQLSQSLFGEDVPLGRQFIFHDHNFIVLGIFNQFDSAPLSLNADFNNTIFIPYLTSEQISNNSAPIDEILAKPVKSNDVVATANSINKNLLAAHSGDQNFTVLRQDQSLQLTGKILNSLTGLVGIIAIISLIVGGVGIMNVTLVAVTERTREIGIRKAVGATNGQILSQFLVESTIMSLTGGVIGVILSLVVDYLLRVLTTLQPIISWQIILISTGVAIFIGIVFGSLPAFQAARKDPIEALRYE